MVAGPEPCLTWPHVHCDPLNHHIYNVSKLSTILRIITAAVSSRTPIVHFNIIIQHLAPAHTFSHRIIVCETVEKEAVMTG